MNTKPSISFQLLLKTVFVVSSVPLMVLAMYAIIGWMNPVYALYAYVVIMLGSIVFVYPFLANVTALTHYVNQLASDQKPVAPDLSVLSTVAELSDSLRHLQRSWDVKRQQMETIIAEREILLDTLPDILIMVDDHKIIQRTNRAARAIFGQNLSGKSLKEIIPNETLLNTIAGVIEDLKGRDVEFHVDEPASHDFHAIIERFPIPSEGGISIIITLNDITELKHAEKMRADFVANASHEIRTPLASISGFIETLRGPAKDDAIAREEFLRVMAEQSERMTKLISDLLSLSKIEMNARTLPVGKVGINEVILKEAEILGWAAEQKKMIFDLQLYDELPSANGDVNEITQVIHNLIGNAVKYGNHGTAVVITSRVTSHLPHDPAMRYLNRAILITVKDRGDGIPRQHLPRLTERFYRVDSARSRQVGGTGLGLAIVKHILNRHRGVLAIDSIVGEGSEFSVYLPLYEDS